MSYYRIGNKVDSLYFYVKAEKPDAAVKIIEEFTGPIAPQQLTVVAVERAKIPEGETVFSEDYAEVITEQDT